MGGGLPKKKTSTGVKNSRTADPRKLLMGLKILERFRVDMGGD